jgi:2-deoxy-D-gluconate 3-dehydrogenase
MVDCQQRNMMILDSFRLDGRVALVTGASAGLGAAIAITLAEAGANVACHGNTHIPSETCQAIEKQGCTALPLKADLSNRAAILEVVEKTLNHFGRIDILVNNAGIIRRTPALEHSIADWDAVLEVNLSSAFQLCQLAGRQMIAQESGKILNIASLLSFQGGVRVAAYAASKGGLALLTKTLANEWAAKNVNVNAIAPGYMATELTTLLRKDEKRSAEILSRIPAGRWGQADDICGAALYLCSDASKYVHGHILVVDGGWMAR